jgi:hypothetical protein
MEQLEQWAKRPSEEANLFNPPFLCALTHEFLKEFSRHNKGGASIFLVVIALATSLHRNSRERLPYSTVTALYAWVQDNEDLLIGFASRAKNICPYVKEAIMFGLATQTLGLSTGSQLLPGAKKAAFSKSLLEEMTTETKAIIDRAKFMGRWLAKSGSEISIAAVLGVRP